MKVLVILACSLTTLAHCSLEPVGYRAPGTYPQTRYLPPSSSNSLPDNRYVPSSVDSPSQNVGKFNKEELSRDLSLPSHIPPMPFSNYLPANRQTSSENNYPSMIYGGEGGNNLSVNQHRPATEIQHSFTQASLPNDYLPSIQNSQRQQARDFSGYSQNKPDRTYLTPNKKTNHFSSTFPTNNGFSSIMKQSNSMHQHGRIEGAASDNYSSGYANQKHSSSSSGGYNYKSPENQTPAQYDFEYEVKDNFGNDYGHKETRNGESTQGVYKVLLPDGRKQTVHYEADSHGYRPTITYEQTDDGSQRRQSTRGDKNGYHY